MNDQTHLIDFKHSIRKQVKVISVNEIETEGELTQVFDDGSLLIREDDHLTFVERQYIIIVEIYPDEEE
ncbi:MAG: hypothetical protein AAB847_02670 [Patescibacteria group bacterium]